MWWVAAAMALAVAAYAVYLHREILVLKEAHANALMVMEATEKSLIARIQEATSYTAAGHDSISNFEARLKSLEDATPVAAEPPEPTQQFRTGTGFRRFMENGL